MTTQGQQKTVGQPTNIQAAYYAGLPACPFFKDVCKKDYCMMWVGTECAITAIHAELQGRKAHR